MEIDSDSLGDGKAKEKTRKAEKAETGAAAGAERMAVAGKETKDKEKGKDSKDSEPANASTGLSEQDDEYDINYQPITDDGTLTSDAFASLTPCAPV